MQAATIDELRKLSFYLLKVNGNDPDQPEFFPRPGEQSEPEMASLAQFANFLKE